MNRITDTLNREAERLRRIRDELRVKAHLGRLEVRERWERAEKAWEQLNRELPRLMALTEEPRKEIAEGARTILRDIEESYTHIRETLQPPAQM